MLECIPLGKFFFRFIYSFDANGVVLFLQGFQLNKSNEFISIPRHRTLARVSEVSDLSFTIFGSVNKE